jgi:gliding motility-associated-like protein
VKSVGWTTRFVTIFIFCCSSSAGFAQSDLFPPVAENDETSTLQNVTVSINVLANDFDPDPLGGISTGTVDLDVAKSGRQDAMDTPDGKYKVNTAGVVTFNPKSDFTGVSSISYTVEDNDGKTSNEATLTITVAVVPNLAPVAKDDNANTTENTAVNVNVVSNDSDDDGSIDEGTVDLNTAESGIQNSNTTAEGTFTVNSSGVVKYQPANNFFGTAVQSYTVNDNDGATSNVATITIAVSSVNAPPHAVDDNASTSEGTPVSFNIVSNDTDSDGTVDASTVDLDTSASGIQKTITTAQGIFTVNNSGVVTYTPAANFSGQASINYKVQDSEGAASNMASIKVTVSAVNTLPVAVNDNASTSEGTPVSFNIVSNDTDSDGTVDASSVDLNPPASGTQKSISTSQGNFTVNNSGVVTFTPVSNFSGQASISYTVRDNDNEASNIATITVTVSSVNAAPVAKNDNASTSEGTPVSFNIVSNDTDGDGTVDASSVDLNPPASGTQKSISTSQGNFTVNNSGVVTFTPVSNFSGQASISYTVRDNDNETSNIATITVTVSSVNAPPVANDDNASTNEGTPVSFNIVSNDTDGDGTVAASSVDLNLSSSGLQKSINTPQGNFAVNSSGIVTYTPVSNFSGQVSIDYTVQDNENATSNIATITVTVGSVNAPPVASNDNASTSESTPVSFNIVLNDSDTDGTIDPSSVDLVPGSAGTQKTNNTPQGNFTVNNSGVVTYTPAADFSGQTSISYTVQDNEDATSNIATITVSVNSVNAPPIASDDNANTEEGMPVSFNIVSNDSDNDGNIDVTSVDLNPSSSGVQKSVNTPQGNFAVNSAGVVTYTPTASFSGLASINYTVKDNEGATSNIANITVAVGSVNLPPIAVDDNANTNEDNPVSLNILTNDTDSDGTIVSSSIDLNLSVAGTQKEHATPQGNFVVNQSGVVTFTPATDFFGQASISYTVLDNEGATSNSAFVKISVSSVNASPVASNDNSSTEQGASISIDIVSNDTDSDGVIDASSVDLNPTEDGVQKSNATADGNFAVNSNGTVTYTPPETFLGIASINYTVLDNEGAISNTASISIEVGYEGVVDLDIPTGFTPNGDGANETWKIQPKDKGSLDYFPNAEIRVYSKRGVLVFEARGFDKNWDGRHHGSLLPADTYYYTIDLRRGNKTRKGIVTILR